MNSSVFVVDNAEDEKAWEESLETDRYSDYNCFIDRGTRKKYGHIVGVPLGCQDCIAEIEHYFNGYTCYREKGKPRKMAREGLMHTDTDQYRFYMVEDDAYYRVLKVACLRFARVHSYPIK